VRQWRLVDCGELRRFNPSVAIAQIAQALPDALRKLVRRICAPLKGVSDALPFRVGQIAANDSQAAHFYGIVRGLTRILTKPNSDESKEQKNTGCEPHGIFSTRLQLSPGLNQTAIDCRPKR
jgi:hypothetical protein